ncbi:hypothetical protein [Shouchella shacheensis]|uniref:hypothetical protein n=1 Tax=Shouchella shacheensis TaxID=1649580 RepID=UPI000740074E|nr:hypothetical protein [Shouchella shacheensis]
MKKRIKGCMIFSMSSALFICGCNSGSSDSSAGSTDGFYESGDTIQTVVPFSAGGGTDVTSRLFAEYWSEYTEGNPAFQVENIEGGGSVNGANEFANLREADGYNVLSTSASTKIPYLIGESHVDFDLQGLQPVVGFPTGVAVYTSPSTGVEEPTDLLNPDEELVMAATTPTGIDVMTLLALEVLGIREDMNIIFGYEGAGASRVAFEQGESNIDYQSVPAYLTNVTPIIEAEEAVPLFTLGFLDDDNNLIEDPALPDLPTVEEVHVEMYGKDPSGEAWDAYLDFVGVVNNLHRGFWMHEDAPEEAVEALREGASLAAEDPDFLNESEEQLGGYDPLVGEELSNAVSNLQEIDQTSLDYVRNFLEKEYDVTGLGE